MSLLSALIVGLALGFVFGGRPQNLGQLKLRSNVLIFVSLAIQLVLFTGLSLPADAVTTAYMISGLLGLIWLAQNFRVAGVPCMLLGTLSNFVTIALNGGRMPIEGVLLAKIRGADYVRELASGTVTSNSSLVNDHTQLWFLTDQILIPKPWPLPTVLSLGDLIIAAGVVWLVAAGMQAKPVDAMDPYAQAA
jgi:hypothetical protein